MRTFYHSAHQEALDSIRRLIRSTMRQRVEEAIWDQSRESKETDLGVKVVLFGMKLAFDDENENGGLSGQL